MATIGATALTYADWAKRMDDGYHVAVIIELLSQTNEILDDMLVVEGNLPPDIRQLSEQVYHRQLGDCSIQAYLTPSRLRAQMSDTCGNLETYSVMTRMWLYLNGNTADFAYLKSKAFLEGMSQQVAATLIYGNQFLTPERFSGLSPRYSTKNVALSQTAANVLDGGGVASTNTSLWIVVWGPDTYHATFPKGKITGLQHRDMGRVACARRWREYISSI